jgi:hypothetical protein
VLLGISIRIGKPQPFPLASIVWKSILGVAPSEVDVEATDEAFVAALRYRLAAAAAGDSAALKALPPQTWSVLGIDGRRVELGQAPGQGVLRYVPPTPEAVRAHCVAAMGYRLREFEVPAAAIRRGLDAMVPLRVLRLFTWKEFSYLVHGEPTVDVVRLRAHCRYVGGLHETHPVVKRLWRVVGGFSHEQKRNFLRFASGRLVLPPPGQWPASLKFKIGAQRAQRVSDKSLIIGATCDFAVYTPLYST